jgi:hypothetical protein
MILLCYVGGLNRDGYKSPEAVPNVPSPPIPWLPGLASGLA